MQGLLCPPPPSGWASTKHDLVLQPVLKRAPAPRAPLLSLLAHGPLSLCPKCPAAAALPQGKMEEPRLTQRWVSPQKDCLQLAPLCAWLHRTPGGLQSEHGRGLPKDWQTQQNLSPPKVSCATRIQLSLSSYQLGLGIFREAQTASPSWALFPFLFLSNRIPPHLPWGSFYSPFHEWMSQSVQQPLPP